MIENSATKGYMFIKIQIPHNNKNIDFDSINEEFEHNIKYLEENEKQIIAQI